MKILVTGGAGYIGSHFSKYLIENKHKVCVLDNLSRGHQEAVPKYAEFVKADLLNPESLNIAVKSFQPEAVVHFAAFAYVGESVQKPEMYYLNNVVGSYNLIRACVESGVKNFVFSSTCSIYGNPAKVPISEEQLSNPINPYANTKLIIETLLRDFEAAHGIKNVCLRYFNAAGADPNSEIGESHNPESHLIPLVIYTAQKMREKILVFGNDYETPDGTCIRDYIHVNDLADAHLRALNYLVDGGDSTIVNLGTGNGNSVLEIIERTKRITGKEIAIELVGRRAGDPAILVADNKKAQTVLDWKPKFGIDEIIQTACDWHQDPKF
ncbi:MAG: UDP-glucose 4-epimerase [Ignavibacteria bacterium]|nr:MAG: UDP-glucose 4-epimerase [Ignavibacteria bacterium]KAF0160704.1 MAG: UDP-glucose 4-epimerase [Ignavibacteria bacterium]